MSGVSIAEQLAERVNVNGKEKRLGDCSAEDLMTLARQSRARGEKERREGDRLSAARLRPCPEW